MDSRKEMLTFIKNLVNNDYNDIESFRILLLTLLLFYDNREQDEELWTELIKTIRTVLDHSSDFNNYSNSDFLYKINRENIEEIKALEQRYDKMNEVLKSILSKRVMCPKSEGKNFKAFF